jgi:hypothetical protein
MPYALVVTVRIVDPSRWPEQRRETEEQALPAVRRLPGFRRYLSIVDHESAIEVGITEWDEREQAEGLRESLTASARQIDGMGILRFVGTQIYEVIGQIDADVPSGD